MKKAEIDINNLPPLSRRLYQFAIENAGSIYAFAKNIELSQPRINSLFHVSEKTGKYPTIQSDVIEAILKKYDLNTNWLYTGSGSVLKNISENSENLLKQSENVLRISIDELINKKIEEAVMESLDKTIATIMDGMNKSNQQQNEHVENILKMQSDENAYKFNVIIDAIREIVKDEDKEKFESKIVQLKTKIG